MKRFFNTVRAYGSFAMYGIALFLVAAPHLYALIGWDTIMRVKGTKHRRRIAHWQIYWGTMLGKMVFDLMGIRVDFDLPKEMADKLRTPFVVVSNHPSGPLDGFLLMTMLKRMGRRDFRSIMKREAAAMPIIGRSVVETECAFLARGGNKDGDLAEIAKCARTAAQDHASIIIFPEGTRFRGPKAGSGLQRVLPPKSGGLKALLSEIPLYPVLSVTIAWNRDIRNGSDVASSLGTYNGARVLVSAEIVNRLHALHADEWLRREWKRKDEFLSQTA